MGVQGRQTYGITVKDIIAENNKTTHVTFGVDFKSIKTEKRADSVTCINDNIAGTPVSPKKVNTCLCRNSGFVGKIEKKIIKRHEGVFGERI